MKTVIICSGEIKNYKDMEAVVRSADLIICADGGAIHAMNMGITPNILLGDFDSIDEDVLNYYNSDKIEKIQYPAVKDMTDSEIAVDLAIAKGSEEVIIIGGGGLRMDHFLGNVFLLKKFLDIDIKASIVDEKNEIILINKHCKIQKINNRKLSLVPISQSVNGIVTKGLQYELLGENLLFGSTRGISNEFCDDEAEIEIQNGLLLVISSE